MNSFIENSIKAALNDIQTKKYNEAFFKLKKIIEFDQKNIVANFYIGNLYLQEKKYISALNHLELVVTEKPKFSEAYNNLGLVYMQLKNIQKAKKNFEKSIKYKTNFSDPYNNLGILFRNQNNISSAEQYFKKAIEINKYFLNSYINLMNLYERLNELDSLEMIIKKAKENFNKNQIIKLFEGKLNFKKKNYKKVILSMQKLNFAEVNTELEKTRLTLLAKTLEKIGEYKKSFETIKLRNELSLKTFPKNINKLNFLNKVQMRKNFFSKNKVAINQNSNNNQIEPVFLFGFPRSGTTLLNIILKSHPKIQTVEEKMCVEIMINELDNIINNDLKNLDTVSDDNLNYLRQTYKKNVNNYLNSSQSSEVIIDKMPLNLIYIGEIVKIFPNAKFIFSVRNPYDCILSCYYQNFSINDSMANFLTLEDSAKLYDEVISLWKIFNEFSSLKKIVIKYEDLVKDFNTTSNKILKFLNLEWSDHLLNFNKTAKESGLISTPSYDQIIKPIYNDSINKYLKYEEHLNKIKPILQKWVKHFNY